VSNSQLPRFYGSGPTHHSFQRPRSKRRPPEFARFPSKTTDNYLTVLKHVGLVLIVMGVLDIAFMIYCITHEQSYTSSLSIFAVIAGILLMRGSLGAARIVTWVVAFMLAGILSAILVLPFLQPFELWLAESQLSPISTIVSTLVGLVTITVLFWIYQQLRTPAVVRARAAVGQSARRPKLAFFLGVFLVIYLAGILYFTMGGESGSRAVQLEQSQFGSGYKYQVNAMQWSGGHYSASLTAYDGREIKPIQVEGQK